MTINGRVGLHMDNEATLSKTAHLALCKGPLMVQCRQPCGHRHG